MKWSFLLVLGTIIFGIHCSSSKSKVVDQIIKDNPDFVLEWAEIDSLEKQGLYKSALAKLIELKEVARESNAHNHYVKSLYYQASYTSQIEEDGLQKSIELLEFEIPGDLTYGHQAIIHSVLGQLYYQYASQYQFRISQRTITEDLDGPLDEWSLSKIITTSNDYYNSSIELIPGNEADLDGYDFLISEAGTTLDGAFTLRTLLMKRAADHFRSQRSLLVEPVNAFRLHDEMAFADTKNFIAHSFESSDTFSYSYRALLLYQQLEKEVSHPTLSAQIEIERIQYAHQIYAGPDKLSLMRNALSTIKDDHKIPLSEQKRALYYLAKSYYNEGIAYQNEFAPELKDKLTIAYDLIKDHDTAEKIDQIDNAIRALISDIKRSDLQLSTELVYLPQEPALFHIQFRNLDEVKFSLIEADQALLEELNRSKTEEAKQILKSKNSIRSWTKNIAADDYNSHASELLLEPMDLGQYILIAESNELFNYGSFHVSNLSYATQSGNGQLKYFVSDRKNGGPVEGVKLSFFKRNYKRNKATLSDLGSDLTDAEGVVISKLGKREAIGVRLEKGADQFNLNNYHSYYDRHRQTSQQHIHVLGDRNLYRPGQTVYIKGIILDSDEYGVATKAIANEKVTLSLRDANGKEVSSQVSYSNEYGSFNNEFILPTSGLNGQYSIRIQGNSTQAYHNFKVEEYKRPKLAVKISQPEEEYEIGDEISVIGEVQMLSGVPVGGAKISYRITRRQRYHYYHRFSRMPQREAQEEIAYGELTSDIDGTFEIDFTLKEAVPSYNKAIYSYEVSVDATDVSGETQSSKSYIMASHQKVFLSLNQSGKVDVSDLDSLRINIKNIAGQDINASGSYIINKLKESPRFKRSKYWGRMDTTLLTNAAYDRVPSDYIMNDASYENWPVERQVSTGRFNTKGQFDIDWPTVERSGVFQIIINNESVSDSQEEFIIRVNDEANHKYAKSDLIHFHTDQDEYEKGGEVALTIASPFEDVNVLYEIEKRGKIIKSERINVGQSFVKINIPITENDIDFLIHISVIHENRSYLYQQPITVTQKEKELDVTVSSFRSVLLPGELVEDWSVTVKDKNGLAVKAEIAASMYDASLDDLYQAMLWRDIPQGSYYTVFNMDVIGFRAQYFRQLHRQSYGSNFNLRIPYPQLRTYGILNYGSGRVGLHKNRAMKRSNAGTEQDGMMGADLSSAAPRTAEPIMEGSMASMNAPDDQSVREADESTQVNKSNESDWSKIRTNLNETVFFYPAIYSDDAGKASLKFTMGEALTKWKFQLFAHTPDAAAGTKLIELTTKKDVMIYPNVSRFARVGDRLRLSGKVINLTDKPISATVQLQLTDASSDVDVTSDLSDSVIKYQIEVAANDAKEVEWWISPNADALHGLIYRMKVESGSQSDGEEGYLPVLTNQVLVTESLPIFVPSQETRSYEFADLKDALSSSSADVLQYSIEYVSNPSWYAVQALPYLSEKRNEGIGQMIERYFANRVGQSIVESNPAINRIFDQWNRDETNQSKLLKNQDLKSAQIDETPWLRAALSETESMKQLSGFFQHNQLESSLSQLTEQIKARQNADGGFSWFPGRRSSLFMTIEVLDKIAKLEDLNITHDLSSTKLSALQYVDDELTDYFKNHKYKTGDKVASSMLHTLYIRSSFISDLPLTSDSKEHIDRIHTHWTDLNISDQAMLALIQLRLKSISAASELYASIQERELHVESKGTYWKHDGSWSNRSAVDRQVLMISLYQEMNAEKSKMDKLRTWLLLNKQSNHWKSTSSTASAVYALLIDQTDSRSSRWLVDANQSIVYAGGDQVKSKSKEAGSLYFRKNWNGAEIKSKLSEIKIENKTDKVNWGSAYVQYMEDIDKITSSESDQLSIQKEIYKEVMTDQGPTLVKLSSAEELTIGNKLIVKLICKADRPLEYIHIKDYRASGTEPTKTVSQYQSQDGLSYYEETKDLSSNFFISHMGRGTHVIEYPLRVNLKGEYSSGIASIQCLYAPEFLAHSNSVNLKIED